MAEGVAMQGAGANDRGESQGLGLGRPTFGGQAEGLES